MSHGSPDRLAGPDGNSGSRSWFGLVGFVTVVLVFSPLFVLDSTVEGFSGSGRRWIVAVGVICGVLLTVSRGAFRQTGVALIVAVSRVVLPYTAYPILAVLLVAVPVVAICALAAGVPYLVSRHRRR
ncbi:hypothetical protein IU448_28275 [Nocardia flavorosea]|uniref:hypothetical protein n=1 Tax=Nocardia flavorosea TaxID=53429 RepID=UPI001893E7FD|nr:hypothetical protein [Nocardia flavorosea]MBF6352878.1 hypothetical protein [Nocardia flavorosea]